MMTYTVQVYDVKFDTTDDGFGNLSQEETLQLERGIEGHIFKIDCDPEKTETHLVEHLICEEISSETGWLASEFNYRHVVIGDK